MTLSFLSSPRLPERSEFLWDVLKGVDADPGSFGDKPEVSEGSKTKTESRWNVGDLLEISSRGPPYPGPNLQGKKNLCFGGRKCLRTTVPKTVAPQSHDHTCEGPPHPARLRSEPNAGCRRRVDVRAVRCPRTGRLSRSEPSTALIFRYTSDCVCPAL